MIAPTHWIKRNMMGTYSETLGRPLTEAELRVQRCLERMPVPDWYQKYSRPSKFLMNDTPFECRPASWKTYKKTKNSCGNTPRKTSRKKSLRNSPEQSPRESESESSRASTVDSGYRGSRKSPKKDKSTGFSSSRSASSGSECEDKTLLAANVSGKGSRSPLNNSNSFPRMSRSRKIENINIVFPKPFPAESAEDMAPAKPARKTVYTMTKNFEMEQEAEADSSGSSRTHASFLIADVEPSGVTTLVKVFAGPLTSDSSSGGSSDEERYSPDSRFFHSSNKSTQLEKIVQTRRSGGRSFIQEIIDELDRSWSGKSRSHAESGEPLGPGAQSFVRSMVSALEQSDEDEDRQSSASSASSDSDLAKSTSISFKSYDSADEQPSPSCCCSSDEEVYWIPCKSLQMPRTSSQLSMMSKGSNGRRSSGGNSPGLSPIKMERRDDWLQREKAPSRQLFRIDETGVADSGYSDDRSTCTGSSRTATLSSERSTVRSSSTPSPSSLVDCRASAVALSRSGAFVMKSFLV